MQLCFVLAPFACTKVSEVPLNSRSSSFYFFLPLCWVAVALHSPLCNTLILELVLVVAFLQFSCLSWKAMLILTVGTHVQVSTSAEIIQVPGVIFSGVFSVLRRACFSKTSHTCTVEKICYKTAQTGH